MTLSIFWFKVWNLSITNFKSSTTFFEELELELELDGFLEELELELDGLLEELEDDELEEELPDEGLLGLIVTTPLVCIVLYKISSSKAIALATPFPASALPESPEEPPANILEEDGIFCDKDFLIASPVA